MTDEPHDIAALSYYQKRIRLGQRITVLLKLYAALGISLAILGTGFILYSQLGIKLNTNERVAAAVLVTGVAMAGISFGLLAFRRAIFDRDVEQFAEHQSVGRFIEAWARFEEACAVSAFGIGAGSRPFGLRQTLKKLRSDGKLSYQDEFEAESLLQTRNALVHGAKRFPAKELDAALNQLVALISKLS